MNRTDIAKSITEDLLNNDALDENNFRHFLPQFQKTQT